MVCDIEAFLKILSIVRRGFTVKGSFAYTRVFILCALMTTTVFQAVQAAEERVSHPMDYRGYSNPEYTDYERQSVHVPMSDGIGLAVSIYTPTTQNEADKFPTLLWYLPSHRESIDPESGELFPYGGYDAIEYFTSHGYAYVLAEMRGSGASEGVRFDRSPQIGRDGYELVEWLATQGWADGNVGMIGSSYQGFSQFATAAEHPPSLKAIFPEIAGFDEYSIMFRPGGMLNNAMTSFATGNIARDDENWHVPGARPVRPSAPVVDEDGDGELIDEIPIDKNGNGTFLDDGAPTYRDGNTRDDTYYRASLAHQDNTNIGADLLAAAPYRDSILPGSSYAYSDIGPADKPARIAESGIAVYYRGGWWDYHATDAFYWLATLQGHTPAKLLMAPAVHAGFPSTAAGPGAGPYWKYFDLPQDARSLFQEKLRFFDHYLKGIDNGIDTEPPVYLYVPFKGWRFENEWPLARQQATAFYFSEGGALGTTEPEDEGYDSFAVDFSADSRHLGANRWNFFATALQEPMMATAQDAKRQSWVSSPMTEATEVTGHPLVELWLESTAVDGDVFVYLEDVNPDGSIVQVTDGSLRANFNSLTDNDSMITGESGINIQPELPWPGFSAADYQVAPFASDEPVKLTFDLMATSWTFRPGHRIRVSMAGADWPTYQLHPSLSPNNDPQDAGNFSATLMILRSPSMASRITLPIIPAEE